MTYVPGFTNDVFISFAHLDDSQGWVADFERRLQDRLRQIGADVTVWRDRKLRGTDVFSDEIFTQLRDSALLVSILSPSGIRSHWCEDERQAFERFAALNGGFRIGNLLRAVKVVKTPLPGDKHRPLFGVLGFEFYERDSQSGHFYEFEKTGPQFERKLDELSQDIMTALDSISRHADLGTRKTYIYLATTSPDLTNERRKVSRQINDWGYSTLPQTEESLRTSASFQAVARAELANSLFSIHLVSHQPVAIDDSNEDSITFQYELAEAEQKDRIVWKPPESAFFPEFETALDQGLQKGLEILRDRSFEDLKDVIEEKLNLRRQQPPPPEPPERSTTRVELYLLCDRADHPSEELTQGAKRAQELKEYLERKGLAVVPPPFSDMEWNELKQEYEEELKLNNAVLLFWGEADENWFLKMRRLVVIERNRRNRASTGEPLTEAFYFTSPPLKKSQYRNLVEFSFEQFDDFKPEELQSLINRLLATEGTA
jgi:hypothetical protein